MKPHYLNLKSGLKLIIGIILLIVITDSSALADNQIGARTIESHKECPLCGMYPARYPEFQCQIIFKDLSYEAFDSPLGLLIYYLFQKEYDPKNRKIENIFFKDYIKNEWISANDTLFVVGTEIMGPMGIDFLPVSNKNDAKQLNDREKGSVIVSFADINQAFLLKAYQKDWVHHLGGLILSEK
jgi:copper chaperone NosL